MAMQLEPNEIKALRRSLGETLKAFGKRFGVTEGTVSYWESGHCHPRWDTNKALNDLLEKTNGKRMARS